MFDAKDKVVLVTGGSTGIGAGIVKAFIEEGAKHVAILDVDIKGIALADELTKQHGKEKVKFYKCDVTSNDLNEAYDAVSKSFGYIDVVVNNAGILNDAAFEKQIAVNVTAVMASSFIAYKQMRKDHGGKGGTIVNISSIVALYPARLLPGYSATKSAVLQFSTALGSEVHFSRSGVRVLTMCFGCTETNLFTQSKLMTFDQESDDMLWEGLKQLPWQKVDSAVKGVMDVYKVGASASTWLVSANRPAEDITGNISKAFEIMSQGVFTK